VTAAERQRATPRVAERYCGCVVRVLEELPPEARQALTPDSPLLGKAAEVCNAGVGETGASPSPETARASAAFDRATYEACVPAAERNNVGAETAKRYCACIVRVLGELPAERKVALTPSAPEVQDAVEVCRAATVR
jgi:hypothetical protein